MKDFSFVSTSAQETIKFAVDLAKKLRKGDILCLFGDLGTGKTTFVKGIAQGLKVKASDVNSPTFILMNIYEGKTPMYHFDLYRLEHIHEISRLGYEEFFYNEGISLVEWAEKLGELIPEEYLAIELIHQGENKRLITLRPHGKRYMTVVAGFSPRRTLKGAATD